MPDDIVLIGPLNAMSLSQPAERSSGTIPHGTYQVMRRLDGGLTPVGTPIVLGAWGIDPSPDYAMWATNDTAGIEVRSESPPVRYAVIDLIE